MQLNLDYTILRHEINTVYKETLSMRNFGFLDFYLLIANYLIINQGAEAGIEDGRGGGSNEN